MSTINTKYGENFVKENLMGPNSMKLIEELVTHLEIEKGMRVLDLGCGKGLTSIYLANEYDVTVFATDLWISATENFDRFKSFKLEDKIIPIHSDARSMPYPDEYFDIVISVDAYHYFGTDELYLNEVLTRFLKKDGQLAIAIPGLKKEFSNEIPKHLVEFCTDNDFLTFHSKEWWEKLWQRSHSIEVIKAFDLNCSDEAWQDWLSTDNINAIEDIQFYNAIKNEFTTPAIIARKK